MTKTLPRLLLMAQEDLKCELYELKKRFHEVSSENYLFKVKVRKLQNEVDKKNKQIECLLDPRKSTNVRKIISERGATMIINLKQRNSDLEEALLSKDVHIKKLQSIIDTSKVYSTHENKQSPQKLYDYNSEKSYRNNKLRSRSLSVTPVPKDCYLKANSDIQLEYVRLAQNLQKIKLANNNGKRLFSQNASLNTEKQNEFPSGKALNSEGESDSSGNERNDLEEYLANMIAEMDKMKQTISELSLEQTNMKQILKDKNSNIEVLAKRVHHLQRRKYKKKFNSQSPRKVSQKLEPNVDETQDKACKNEQKMAQKRDENTAKQAQTGLNAEPEKVERNFSTETYTQDSFEEVSESKTTSSNDSSTNSTVETSTVTETCLEEDNDDDDVETGD